MTDITEATVERVAKACALAAMRGGGSGVGDAATILPALWARLAEVERVVERHAPTDEHICPAELRRILNGEARP